MVLSGNEAAEVDEADAQRPVCHQQKVVGAFSPGNLKYLFGDCLRGIMFAADKIETP